MFVFDVFPLFPAGFLKIMDCFGNKPNSSDINWDILGNLLFSRRSWVTSAQKPAKGIQSMLPLQPVMEELVVIIPQTSIATGILTASTAAAAL